MFLNALHFCAISRGFLVAATNLVKSPSVSLAKALHIIFIILNCPFLPSDHISALVDVGYTEEEALDTRDPLSEMTFWVVAIV